ncbi:hypothetical protein [Tenacibaculum sp. 190524A02b]|uniref:hypothetical protein n=1 Tax=Tenacibaculum vairaonense TaxID=3137860 RepID=UPI0031FAD944
MKKLSLEALQSRAKSVVSIELLEAISGGTEDACHDRPVRSVPDEREQAVKVKDAIQ